MKAQTAKDNAGEQLSQRYWRPLLAFFSRRLSDQSEAEDLVQEVISRLLARSGRPSIRNPDAFVFQVATNLLRDHTRRKSVMKMADYADVDALTGSEHLHNALIEHHNPERILVAKEELVRVIAALNELSERTHAVFILSRVEGVRQKDIANALGISTSAVEKHLVKAISRISRAVAEE